MAHTQTNAKKTPQKELPYIIEDFLNIDPAHITLGAPKPNKFQGSSVPVRYKGKALYVKYDARTCPFGASASKEEKDEYKQSYALGKKITGYTTSIQCEKDYENDPYYKKAAELDLFFIEQCIQNSLAWGLGGSKTKPIAREAIEGYDDKGDNGKWKRLVKYAYKKVGTEKVYTEYAPRLEFGLLTDAITESKDSDGKLVQHTTFKTAFFTADGDKLDVVTADSMPSGKHHDTDISTCMPNWSKIAVLSQWTSISLGTYGASLKPKASQIRVFPNERLNNDECMLGAEDEADEDFCMPDGLALGGPVKVEPVRAAAAPVPLKPVAPAAAPVKKPAPLVVQPPAEEPEVVDDPEEPEEVVEEEEEVEEVVEEVRPPPPAAKPAAAAGRRTTRVVAAKH
jgi:hypothetical protein